MNELPDSAVERQNILNDRAVVETVQQALRFTGVLFEGEYRYTKKMVADFYEVGVHAVDRYLDKYGDELKGNGYLVCDAKSLEMMKSQFGCRLDESTGTAISGLFDFRSMLNLGMLLTESEKARWVRSLVLDIVLDSINSRTGGGSKYLNRRAVHELPAAVNKEKPREKITSAVCACVSGHRTLKYAQVADLIDRALFREKAREYREILRLCLKDSSPNPLCADVLSLVSSFEDGVAEAIRRQFADNGHRLLSVDDVRRLIEETADSPTQNPFIEEARSKMASPDFTNVGQGNAVEHWCAETPDEFERFIGDKAVEFDAILEDHKDVLKRLKQDGENE